MCTYTKSHEEKLPLRHFSPVAFRRETSISFNVAELPDLETWPIGRSHGRTQKRLQEGKGRIHVRRSRRPKTEGTTKHAGGRNECAHGQKVLRNNHNCRWKDRSSTSGKSKSEPNMAIALVREEFRQKEAIESNWNRCLNFDRNCDIR